MTKEIHTLLIDATLKKIAQYASKHNASDLHISTENSIFMRVNGLLDPIKHPPIPAALTTKMFNSISSDKQKSELEKNKECDFVVVITDEIRMRVNAFYARNGLSIAARFIPTKEAESIEHLDCPDAIQKACSLQKGLVLITGPTGSGKSTTLAGMIAYINENYNRHIITIEDPIEFLHKSKKSLIQQREVGISSSSFSNAVRASLRQDPDIIVIGEMRDVETIRAGIYAAETGHLVFGTMHTNSASNTINRIINTFPSEEQSLVRSLMSKTLKVVVSQRLILSKDKKSRRGAFEVMISSNAISNLILENKIAQIDSLIEISKKTGSVLMKNSIQKLLDDEKIDENEANTLLNSYK
jgi:twitching motility protein PilT